MCYIYSRHSAYDFVFLFIKFFHDLLYLFHFEHWDTNFVDNEYTDMSCLLRYTIEMLVHGFMNVEMLI